MINTQSNIPISLQVELEAIKRGLDLSKVRSKLKMKQSLFSHAKAGKRQKQFQRLIAYIEKFPVINK